VQALKPVDEWLESYRRLWEERFDRLDDYLRELQAQEEEEKKQKDKAKDKLGGRARRKKESSRGAKK
jgi:hypothetical protein